jgi:hypothetical protein
MPLVDIREMWFTDGGDMRPSKKGVLVSTVCREQYEPFGFDACPATSSSFGRSPFYSQLSLEAVQVLA